MKKRLLVFLAVLLVLAACTPGALAYDVAAEQAEDFGTASLEYALPEQAYDAFGALSVADAAQPQSLLAKLWAYVLHEGGGAVASAARNAALLLAVVFLSALCASISVSGACGKVTQMAGTVAVAALSATHVTSCITAGSGALATLRDFSKILLPSMCAAAAASGAATSAAAKYAATSLFLDVLLSAETAVLLPLLYLYAGTVICGTTLENDVLTSLSGLLRKAFRLLIIGFASAFTLYLSLTASSPARQMQPRPRRSRRPSLPHSRSSAASWPMQRPRSLPAPRSCAAASASSASSVLLRCASRRISSLPCIMFCTSSRPVSPSPLRTSASAG